MKRILASLIIVGNTWVGAWGPSSLVVLGTCALGQAQSNDVSVSVWIAETGTEFLDIIQIGAMTFPDGRIRYFAAWGNGVPMTVGSSYAQVDLGQATRGAHVYRLSLANRIWSLYIDNKEVYRVSDNFRHWRLRKSQAMAEAEGSGDTLGGSLTAPTWCNVADGWQVGGWGRLNSSTYRITTKGWKAWRNG
jgi:hypothetical protein